MPEITETTEREGRNTWNLKHALWTVLHDILTHPLCGILWAINRPLPNRFAYWLHDVTLPSAWERNVKGKRVPV